MNKICIIDTSIFTNILNIPGKNQSYKKIIAEAAAKLSSESLFLPMATIFETGNHIGQIANGSQRRTCADRFVKQVSEALAGKTPFKPISFSSAEELEGWLDEFPNHATSGSGLGDLSIIHDWKRMCSQNTAKRVYIWTLDTHLSSFDRPPLI